MKKWSFARQKCAENNSILYSLYHYTLTFCLNWLDWWGDIPHLPRWIRENEPNVGEHYVNCDKLVYCCRMWHTETRRGSFVCTGNAPKSPDPTCISCQHTNRTAKFEEGLFIETQQPLVPPQIMGLFPWINVPLLLMSICQCSTNVNRVMIWNECTVMHSSERIYILYPSAEILAELSFVLLLSPVHYLPAGREWMSSSASINQTANYSLPKEGRII